MPEKKCRTWACFLVPVLVLVFAGCRIDRGPDVDQDWSDWIKANHHPLRSLDDDDTDYEDLQFLKPLLAGRRLVQLGENGHGVGEFSRAKVRLIKFLHEEMDFDVIAFESNIFECYQANSHSASWTAEEMMGRSIFGVWYTEDVLELFRYIKESKFTSRPLILAGFDVQNSSWGKYRRPDVFQEAIARIDPVYAGEVERNDKEFLDSFSGISSWPASQVDQYKLFYDSVRQWFDEHLEELIPYYPHQPLLPLVLRQAAWSQRINIDTRTDPDQHAGYNLRDQGMAENVGVLLERLYPEKKIMLWAHNLHVDHDPNLTGVVEWDIISMGYWLAQRYRPILYTIGFFMYQGEVCLNSRETCSIDPAPSGTLEAILYQTGADFVFLDMLGQQSGSGTSWMFGTIRYRAIDLLNNDRPTLVTMMPRWQFDGILYVKTVHIPPYVTYYELPDEVSSLEE